MSDQPSDHKYNQKNVLDQMIRHIPDLPAPVVKAGLECIIDTIRSAISEGRSVALRGFGRFVPRRYTGDGQKKIGLLFHPGSRLVHRINNPRKKHRLDRRGL